MNISPLNTLLGFLLILSGCTNRGNLALRQDGSSDLDGITAKAAAIQQTSLDRIETDRPETDRPETDRAESDQTPTALVSDVSTPVPVAPSLMTLPKGDDLSAQIDRASGPVLLDFFAIWCGPCRTQSQILHDLDATAAENQTLIIKIDVDEHPQLAKEYQVASLPTLMMLKNGEIVRRQSGVAKKSDLVAWMK